MKPLRCSKCRKMYVGEAFLLEDEHEFIEDQTVKFCSEECRDGYVLQEIIGMGVGGMLSALALIGKEVEPEQIEMALLAVINHEEIPTTERPLQADELPSGNKPDWTMGDIRKPGNVKWE